MEKERKVLLEHLNNVFIKVDTIHILNNTALPNPKSSEASEEAKRKGDALFLLRKKHDAEMHKAIFNQYCESIASAPTESPELALAYGNRAYLLLHMRKYEDCIKDIDKALLMLIADVLRAKLLCFKVECLKKLGSSNVSHILELIQNLAEKIEGQDRMQLQKMIDVAKGLAVDTKKAGMSSQAKERIDEHESALTDDYSSRVSVEYSEKYGRHLVAAQDYKPGDVIFIERMYAAAFIEGSSLLACDHCFKLVWSSIPCSHCNWSMYCSESCKEHAWNEYHDIECPVITHLKQFYNLAWRPAVMALRVLIRGIKETGSIANLKKELELLDQRPDNPPKDFFKNGQFGINNIQNIYSLDTCVSDDDLVAMSTIVPPILISLTKLSKLKDNFNVGKIEDLQMNEEIMFLGSFLIKIMAVLSSNSFAANYDDFPLKTKHSKIAHFDEKKCLSVIFSLANHSCFPNADWRCIEPDKVLVYALHPIKKNSQIFVSYCHNFENEILAIRQDNFSLKYNFKCDCQACVEIWPPIETVGAAVVPEQEGDAMDDFRQRKIFIEDLKEVIDTVQDGRPVTKSHIEKLSLLITQGINWKQPSEMFLNFTNFLRIFFTTIYAPKSLVFGKCD